MAEFAATLISLTRGRRQVYIVLISSLVSSVITITLSMMIWKPKTSVEIHPKTECVMTMPKVNDLGNALSNYAILYSLAQKYDCKPVITSSVKHRFLGCFSTTISSTMAQYETAPWKDQHLPSRAADYKFKPNSEKCTSYVRMYGHSWDWRYFQAYEADIRHEFIFLPETKHVVEEFLLLERRKRQFRTVTYIGIYVRRRDAIYYLRGYHCKVADKDFLLNAMETFKAKYPDALFVVASDDLQWCKTVLKKETGFDITFVDRNFSDCVTMALLVQCDHSIMTNGPFSFWSSYLAAGDVIYFDKYCNNNTGLVEQFSVMYLPHWHGIPATANKIIPPKIRGTPKIPNKPNLNQSPSNKTKETEKKGRERKGKKRGEKNKKS